jgi:hypothetical protein
LQFSPGLLFRARRLHPKVARLAATKPPNCRRRHIIGGRLVDLAATSFALEPQEPLEQLDLFVGHPVRLCEILQLDLQV